MEYPEGVNAALWLVPWLLALTVAMVRQGRANDRERRALQDGLRKLEIRETMHEVIRLVSKKAIHDDARLREAVERLIARMEADPLTAGSYRIDLTSLKAQIR